jgi:hypothetical protein
VGPSQDIPVRSEPEIFSDLADLCSSPGYIHVIAYLCYRDDTIGYSDKITIDDILQQYSPNRLIRTEMSTLIRLCCESNISRETPAPDNFQNYIDRTDTLLIEMHHSMVASIPNIFDKEHQGDESFQPLKDGNSLREAIFYGGESALPFQYREFSQKKYRKDDAWFVSNKGFSVQQADSILQSIDKIQNGKINDVLHGFRTKDPITWSFLDAYMLSPKEISNMANVDINVVKSFLESFVIPGDIGGYNSVDDFNQINSTPIIKIDDKYFLFQNYTLVESMYETPFFWFKADKEYSETAMQHRGEFTEDFSAERLELVFGNGRVFKNITIYDHKYSFAVEIDVLVIFGDRALIIQAKSKKLTIAARKGNEVNLRDDFKKAVQDAYDQAYKCADLLNNLSYKLVNKNGEELGIKREYVEIYPICIVSDNYPALSFQARQFLDIKETKNIKSPFVMDVFFLDVATEMLQSPLHFMSYINRRITYGDKILSTFEMTTLAYHLKNNLWVDGEYSMIYLQDEICADLDLAMRARREGIQSIDTPEGILTKYKGTYFDQIINDIDSLDCPATINLGFMLLSLDEKDIEVINDGVAHLIKTGKADGYHHDLTLAVSEDRSGLTIHCNKDPLSIAGPRLDKHCTLRKYALKANVWFGICLWIDNPKLRFGIAQKYEWIQSNEMDEEVKDLAKPQNIRGKRKVNFTAIAQKTMKIGRNEKCPCGSGKKYKQCCLL